VTFGGAEPGLAEPLEPHATIPAVVGSVHRRGIRRVSRPLRMATPIVLVAGMALGLSACGNDGGNLPDGVVARVGDSPITRAQLDRSIEQRIAQSASSGQAAPTKGSKDYTKLEQTTLESVWVQRVISIEAAKCGTPCKVSSKEIDTALADVQKQAPYNGSKKKLDDFLAKSKITPKEARELLRTQLTQPKLQTFQTRGIRFTDAEAKTFYDANLAQFKTPESVAASHILVATEAKAKELRAQATTANFAELAKKNSTDKGSAVQGGSLGDVPRGQTVPEFEKVTFATAPGEISQPVKTQFGWHIIYVTAKNAAKQTPFAAAKAGIIAQQLQAKRDAKFRSWSDGIVKDWRSRTVYASNDLKPPATTASTTPTAPTP
jgi:PPIC-type PPIASE domain/SurA N-terminal domain